MGIYTVELYLKVRHAHFQDGLSGRQIARDFGISRDSVAKMLAYSEPPGYRRTAPIRHPNLDAFTSQIDQWLAENRGRPHKQRHTAKRIFERLRDECGFDGSYTIVKDYVRDRKRTGKEMFVPLSHPPGHAQADFGEALVVIGGVEQKAHFFALDMPHSVACYIRDRYDRPGKGNDKGAVEGLVGYGRRNFMVPIPSFPDWHA